MVGMGAGHDPDDMWGEAIRQWLTGYDTRNPVIAVPVYNAFDEAIECLESLLSSSGDTPILIVDDGSTDARIPETLSRLARERGFFYARKPANEGFVATMNAAFAWTAPRDVVLVNSDVIVPPCWLERLRAAAYARTTIATATPLTNHGTIVSVPYRNRPIANLPRRFTVAEFDRQIQRASKKLYPVIPTAIGHCTYFKRSALNVVGDFDTAFAPGYGEEVDFSQRAVMIGLCHVVADDLFVLHKGSRSFNREGDLARTAQVRRVRQEHERRNSVRYPWYHTWVRNTERDGQGPLALALDIARMATLGKDILLDMTSIRDVTTGTQVVTLELARALCETKPADARLTLLVNDELHKRTLLGIDELADGVITMSAFAAKHHTFDLIHRPFQVGSLDELHLYRATAHRTVITQLDLIAYTNPSYFPRTIDWLRYRSLTKRAMAMADGIAFISADSLADAVHQGINLPRERACVTYIGVDHQWPDDGEVGASVAALEQTPFLLVLGTDFRHKNRPYALDLFQSLVECHGWQGLLVFAGPKVDMGSSATEEALRRIEHANLAPRVRYMEQISESEKRWLLAHAAVVLYPSIYEGFGIVPFEAALLGTPTLSSDFTSLREVLGNEVRYLSMKDADADAAMILRLLANPGEAADQIQRILARSGTFTWQAVATRTWDFYHEILRLPPRPVSHEGASGDETLLLYEKQQKELHELRQWARKMEADYQELEIWAKHLNDVATEQQEPPPPPTVSARIMRRLQKPR